MNKRLGTRGLTIPEATIEAAKRNITAAELVTIIEEQGWEYEGIEPRDGESYVCSSYVTAVLKAAGVFGDVEIHATEFTPRDLVELNFWDNKFKPSDPRCYEEGVSKPWCQFMGKYKMEIPKYGTV